MSETDGREVGLLQRWGFRFNVIEQSVEFIPDGFWTPWHIAQAELDRLRAENEALRSLCAAAYQAVGAADGPVEMLDNLSAAADGRQLSHDPMAGLPWVPAPHSK